MYVCMDVWGGASAWAWSSKTLSFYGGRPSPCTPPHERAKNVPKRSPGVRFHGGFGRVSFWGFRGPSLHPSIHPCIRSIFTVVFENTRFFMYVKPYFIDIYRRFWNIQTNLGVFWVVTSKCMRVCLALFDQNSSRILVKMSQTSIHTFRRNNSFLMFCLWFSQIWR